MATGDKIRITNEKNIKFKAWKCTSVILFQFQHQMSL